MRKIRIRIMNCILMVSLTAAVLIPAGENVLTVKASNVNDLKNQINNTQNDLNHINDKISDLSDEQDLIQEKMDDLNAEIINTMTSIGMKEDEIAQKEAEIAVKQGEIGQAQEEYEAAKLREEQQYEAMKVRIRFMYENNNTNWLSVFMEGSNFSDMLNKAECIEKIYQYDQKMLDEYEATKNQVHDLWDSLEVQKAQFEQDKAQLEKDREALKEQKSVLDGMMEQKKKESANFDAEIKKAKAEAAVAKKLLQQEQQQLKKLQEKDRKNQVASNAGNGKYNVTGFDTNTIDNSAGSDLGKKIAKYACQYIGYPYVAGGTSLTNGADCSGFTYRVLKDFGYDLPRTSYEQRSAGTGVSYEQAQPGDLVCYEGHVGLYVGGGYIVHASTERTGIKISKATYRSILSVRRVI